MNNFDRIAGYEKEKEQLKGLRDLLLHYDDYKKSGIHIPRGVLLYGEPGVGKTVMAKAVAEAPITCVEICSADCTRDDAANYILAAFEKARNSIPSVLLIDELDKIAEQSSSFFMEGNDHVMKVLLQELDGHKNNEGVLVVATCNQCDRLNPALIRSGRFDRIIKIGSPSMEDRQAIIQYYLSNVTLEKQIDEVYFAKITSGYSGAQLESIINEAGILALQNANSIMGMTQIRTAMNRIAFRSLEGNVGEEKERRVVATHEAGHALVALLLSPDKLTGASIIPQGSARGHVRMRRSEDNAVINVADMEKEITVALAGAAAENVAFHTTYMSSSSDYKSALKIIDSLITEMGAYGLDMVLPEKTYGAESTLSAELIEKICNKRTEVLSRLFNQAIVLLQNNREAFRAIIDALVDRYSLTTEEITDICQLSLQQAQTA